MNKTHTKTTPYAPPQLVAVQFRAERGFAFSLTATSTVTLTNQKTEYHTEVGDSWSNSSISLF